VLQRDSEKVAHASLKVKPTCHQRS